MTLVKKIRKSGNSGAVTIDKTLMDLMHLKFGDQVTITFQNGRIIIAPANVGFSENELDAAAETMFRRYRKTFKKLAE